MGSLVVVTMQPARQRGVAQPTGLGFQARPLVATFIQRRALRSSSAALKFNSSLSAVTSSQFAARL
jgi:hypothetical protein